MQNYWYFQRNAVDVFGSMGGGSSGKLGQIRTLVQSKNAPKPPAIKQPPVKPPVKPAAKPAAKPPVKPPVKPAAKPAVKPPVKPVAKPDIPALTVESKIDYNEALLELINESQNNAELLGDDDIKDALALSDLDGFKTGAEDGTGEDATNNGATIEAVHGVQEKDLPKPNDGVVPNGDANKNINDGAKDGVANGSDTDANIDPSNDGSKDGVDIDIVPVAGANNSLNDDSRTFYLSPSEKGCPNEDYYHKNWKLEIWEIGIETDRIRPRLSVRPLWCVFEAGIDREAVWNQECARYALSRTY